MNAVLKPEGRLEPLTEALLDDVLRIENRDRKSVV